MVKYDRCDNGVFLGIGGVSIKYGKCKVCLCVCPCSAVKCSIVYYGSMHYILCVCLLKT